MLSIGIRRFFTQQSNGILLSSNYVALMEQENDKETKKDFKRIVKLLEQSPIQQKRKKQLKKTEDDSEKREEKTTTNWKEHISKSLHKSYDDYAMKENMESWKRRARNDTFCYMRDRNLVDLIDYTHRYLEKQIELNAKTNRRTFEDNELVAVVLKFVMNELLKGNGDHSLRDQHTEKPPK